MWPFSVKEPTGRRCPWWIVEMMIRQWGHPALDPTVADAQYLLPDDPGALIRRSNAHRQRYKKESRDCDDMVRILRGWLSQKGLGHIFCAELRVCIPNSRTPKNSKRHAAAGFIGRNDRLYAWDVQTAGVLENAKILGLWV